MDGWFRKNDRKTFRPWLYDEHEEWQGNNLGVKDED
jgi:hypothetical protein